MTKTLVPLSHTVLHVITQNETRTPRLLCCMCISQFVHVYMNFNLLLTPEAHHTKTTQHLQWPSHTNRWQKSILLLWENVWSGNNHIQVIIPLKFL